MTNYQKALMAAILLILFSGFSVIAQNSYIGTHSLTSGLIERYEIKAGNFRDGFFSDIRPYSRAAIEPLLLKMDSLQTASGKTDWHNRTFLSREQFPSATSPAAKSKKPIFKTFYKSPANFYEIDNEQFKLIINPGFNFQAGYPSLSEGRAFINTRAIEVRGQINKVLGFYSFISENQEVPLNHQRKYAEKYRAYPGIHHFKPFKTDGIDYFNASGYITVRVLPAVSVMFGHSRNFIGFGQRSLFLSDFATDYLFMKINTKIWVFNYQNIFAQLVDKADPVNTGPWPKKYLALHYLSVNLSKKLNIGLVESITFHDNKNSGRGFDFNYLNPVIFYRAVEHYVGDPDKVMVGLNLGYNPFRNIRTYGQLMINEFRLNDLREGNGHYGNKFGYQLGLKYIDVAGLSNVDLSLEYNQVRPYSYAHYTVSGTYPVNSYSHYNQHLAHPLGANFKELLLNLKARPAHFLFSEISLMYAQYGDDANGSNWGQNIFLDYSDNERELGNYTGQGIKTELMNLQFLNSIMLRHNLFVDIDLKYRRLISEIETRSTEDLYFSAGLRLNLAKTKWEY